LKNTKFTRNFFGNLAMLQSLEVLGMALGRTSFSLADKGEEAKKSFFQPALRRARRSNRVAFGEPNQDK